MSKGLSLRARIFLTTGLLILLSVGAAVAVTAWFGDRIARRAAAEALSSSTSALEAFEIQRYQRLDAIARSFANDSYSVAYVAEAVERADVSSILNLLAERQRLIDFDFAIFLDPQGRVVVHTRRPDAQGQDFSDRAMVAVALSEFEAFGVWQEEDALYSAVTVPLIRAGGLIGYLVTGFEIDDLFADDIKRITRTEVALFSSSADGLTLLTTSLDEESGDALIEGIDQYRGQIESVLNTGDVADDLRFELVQERWLGNLTPMLDAAGNPVGVSISLASLRRALATYRQLLGVLMIVGLASILGALALSYLLSRRILQPVDRLVQAAEAAKDGDYEQDIPVERSDEVGRLAGAFSALLRSLRERRDMQQYLGELARSFPEAVVSSEEAEHGFQSAEERPSESNDLTLLTVELRGYAHAASQEPDTVLRRLNDDLHTVARACVRRGGRLEALAGHRAMVTFKGDEAARLALRAAAEVLRTLGQAGPTGTATVMPVIAITSGTMVQGNVAWAQRPRPALIGIPVQEADSLVREATPGDLLMSKRVHNALQEHLSRVGIDSAPQRSLVSTQQLYIIDSKKLSAATRHEDPQEDGTVQMIGGDVDVPPPSKDRQTLSGVVPGSIIGRRFEIMEILGSGGMGVIYKARDRQLNDFIALKMLRREYWGDASFLGRLKAEIKLARKVTHPNVLRTFDFDEVEGMPYISMEYVRGVTLRYLLDQTDRVPLTAALRLARQLATGLQAAHRVGVIHRDIKPENLIVDSAGNAKLMDFGIARPAESPDASTTKPGVVIGTPRYLSPEQLQGRNADERSDIYSAGVVLYELFTGKMPFAGESENVAQMITQHLHEDPIAPRQHWSAMPATLEALILRCLTKDPNERFQHVGELLAELDRVHG